MSSYPELDFTLGTRDGEEITLTTAAFTSMGVAEVAITQPPEAAFASQASTVVTAAQARELADAFDRLATFWGE